MMLSDRLENQTLITPYSQTDFPFRQIVSKFCQQRLNLIDHKLEDLHTHIKQGLLPSELVTVHNDQDTMLHEVIYKLDPAFGQDNPASLGFIDLYRKFVKHIQDNVFCEPLVFQRLPTIRIHLPNNMSVGEFHVDSEYNHPTQEINIWVPLTKAYATSTIWMESERTKSDYHPINADVGTYVIFDSLLRHGNKVNVEAYTRISFDFRVIPLAKFENSLAMSVSKNRKFSIGDYYDVFEDK